MGVELPAVVDAVGRARVVSLLILLVAGQQRGYVAGIGSLTYLIITTGESSYPHHTPEQSLQAEISLQGLEPSSDVETKI